MIPEPSINFDTSRERLHAACSTLLRLACFALAASGALKLHYPTSSAVWLPLATDFPTRIDVVLAGSGIEIIIGSLGALQRPNRATTSIACMWFALLIVVHVWSTGLDDVSCGCFGALRPSFRLALATSIIGLGSGALTLLTTPHQSVRRLKRTHVAATASLATIATVASIALTDKHLTHLDEAAAGLPQQEGAHLLVVGSWDCGNCVQQLKRSIRASNHQWRHLSPTITFVTARGSNLPPAITIDCNVHTIPESLWWKLVDRSPPTFIHRGFDGSMMWRTDNSFPTASAPRNH